MPTPDSDSQVNHRCLCDFLLKTLTETANSCLKALAFYFAIMAALTGYIISQRISPFLRDLTFYVGGVVSLFAGVTSIAVAIGLHRGLRTYQRALRELDPKTFDRLDVGGFCRRGLVTFWVIAACFFALIAVFFVGVAKLRALAP